LVALLCLAALEAWLHTDDFPFRFRSVFAVGRAIDKLQYAERHCPELLILGNSRADNAFDPKTLLAAGTTFRPRSAFNLGLPGADTRVLAGVLDRLVQAGCLRPEGVRQAVIVLDEALLQPVDALGQDVFLADRARMLADGQWHDAFRASLRLYGFSANLRQLREPASLQRLVAALEGSVDPVGGAAEQHLGYRAGFGGLQDAGAAAAQEAGRAAPPSAANIGHFWRILGALQRAGVRVAIVYPPLLGREVLYRTGTRPEAAPYRRLAVELAERGLPVISLDEAAQRIGSEFVNPGHLNDRGAQRYTRLLAQALDRVWATSSSAAPSP
jgi:hypothetical protein